MFCIASPTAIVALAAGRVQVILSNVSKSLFTGHIFKPCSTLPQFTVWVLFLFIFREPSLVDNVFTIRQMKLDCLKLQSISFFCAVRIWIEA